ncbi:MAG: hypothetical protein IJ133_05645 [Clostridia bacterium]|nr:hypothetical protein [Clostridia bacterium]
MQRYAKLSARRVVRTLTALLTALLLTLFFCAGALAASAVPRRSSCQETGGYWSYQKNGTVLNVTMFDSVGDDASFLYPFYAASDTERQNLILLFRTSPELALAFSDLVTSGAVNKIVTDTTMGTETYIYKVSGGRVTEISASYSMFQTDSGSLKATLQYDANGAPTSLSVQSSDAMIGSESTTYAFKNNASGLTTGYSMASKAMSGKGTVSLTLDPAGRVAKSVVNESSSIFSSSTTTTTFTYNADGHPTGISLSSGNMSSSSAFSYTGDKVTGAANKVSYSKTTYHYTIQY